MAMAWKALADHFAFQDFQGSEQRRGPVANIVVGEGAATALLEGQTRLSAIQSLNLALFIDTQDQAFVGWIEVKPDHVGHFFQKLFVPRELKGARSVGLKIIFLPQPVYRAGADILNSRHRSTTPMSRAFGLSLQCGTNDGV